MNQLKKQKIAFFFLHMHKGGMQKAVSRISTELSGDFEIFIVCFGSEEPGFVFGGSVINLDVPGSSRNNFFQKLKNFIVRRKKLQNFVNDYEINVLIGFGEPANFMSSLVRCPYKVFSVRSFINKSLTGFYGLLYKVLIKVTYPFADRVVAVSNGIRIDLIENYRVPEHCIRVVHNLFDHDLLLEDAKEPLEAEFKEIFDKQVVISVGSLTELKGFDHLINAFSLAKRREQGDLQLVILGSGEGLGALKKLARELKIENEVHFPGFRVNPYKFLSRSDLFVLPSHLEGFPNVLVEAMICGLPVISTDCSTGPREILGNSKYGILVDDITNVNQASVERKIAEGIITLISTDAGASYGEKGRKRTLDFGKDKIVGQWLEILS